MAKIWGLARVYDEKYLKTIGLESATRTSLVAVPWPSILVSIS